MGNEPSSKFQDRNQWLTLNKHSKKEVLLQKQGGLMIEKHVIENTNAEEIHGDGRIYQWRSLKNNLHLIVQILETLHINVEEEGQCRFCRHDTSQVQLIVYTEHLNKLYENNPKIELNLDQQFAIFKNIIEGIQFLCQKFGYFAVSKEMIGFNNKKVGKVWINQNFASNRIQFKRKVDTNEERLKWERQIIEDIIDICLLCAFQNNSHSTKLYGVIEKIRKKQLLNFTDLKKRYNQPIIEQKKEQANASTHLKAQPNNKQADFILQNQNQSQEIKKSSKEVKSTTRENNQKAVAPQKEEVNSKKRLMMQVMSVKNKYSKQEKEKISVNHSFRNSYHSRTIENQFNQASHNNSMYVNSSKANFVHVNRHTQSFISPIQPNKGESHLPLFTICEANELTHMNMTSPSPAREDRREQIKMIDSMIMVERIEKQQEKKYLSSDKNNIILEESLIVWGS